MAANAAAEQAPKGVYDGADCSVSVGWTCDPDGYSQAVTVHMYADGPAGQGTFIGAATANLAREAAVGAVCGGYLAHGFTFATPASLKDGRAHTLYAYALNPGGSNNPLLAGSPGTITCSGVNGNSTISGAAGGSNIVIKTTSRLAGAIDSLTWKGKEFVNSYGYDHGRQIQSASFLDGYGECYNPTEAGSQADGTGATSSSILKSLSASGNTLTTQTQMAFWGAPGGHVPSCGMPRNTTVVSDHILTKNVRIGFAGMPHVIEYLVNFYVSEPHNSANFEAVTGYMPPEFSSFFTYNPETGAAPVALSGGPGEQGLPIIFATADRNHAMGVYSPDLTNAAGAGSGYGRFDAASLGDQVVKWNMVFRRTPAPAGNYGMRCYVIAGSLENVKTSMTQLHRYFYQSSPDATAPSAPSGLSAAAVSSSQINLSWSASTDNVGVTGYRVYRGGTLLAGVTGTSYQDSGLGASTAYSYKVAASDAAGNVSAQSSAASAATPAAPDTTSPGVPAGLAAAGRDRAIDLSWAAATDAGGSGLAGYRVDVSSSLDFSSFAEGYQNKEIGLVTSLTATGLGSGTVYYARLRARDGNGNSSLYSAAVSAETNRRRLLFAFGTSKSDDPSGQTALMEQSVAQVAFAFTSMAQPAFEAEVIVDPNQISVASIKSRLAYYKATLGPNDTFVVYSHTHGLAQGLWLNFSGPQPSQVLPWRELADIITSLPARNVIVLTMSCHSGGLADALKASPGAWQGRSLSGRNLVVLTAVSAEQIASASGEANVGNSFTYAAWTGISGSGDGFGGRQRNGRVELAELANYALYTAREKSKEPKSNPQFAGDYSAEDILAAGYSDRAAPSTPQGLVLAGGDRSLALSWLPAADAGGSALQGYRLDASLNSGFTSYVAGWQDRDAGLAVAASLAGLLPGTRYHARVRAYDGAGNVSAQSVSASAATAAEIDTTPPSVSITAPAEGTVVSGNIAVTAGASDSVGVSKVEFYIDGALKHTDTSSPYSYSQGTTQLSNAAHAINARAYDAAGNAGASVSVNVIVSNAAAEEQASEVVAVKTVAPDAAAMIASTSPASRPMSVSIPAASFAGEVVLSLKQPYSMPPPDPVLNADMKSTGVGMEITLDQAAQPVKAATLEITYTDAEMAGVDRTKLVLARYDEISKGWLPLESVSYPDQNKVVGRTTHFSLFQVMALTAGAALDTARIYPNPFYPNKGHTQVTMDGVPEGTTVKVYTLNGELVWEGGAGASGLAVWYGRNKAGRKAASGLYLVYFEHGGKKKLKKVSVVK